MYFTPKKKSNSCKCWIEVQAGPGLWSWGGQVTAWLRVGQCEMFWWLSWGLAWGDEDRGGLWGQGGTGRASDSLREEVAGVGEGLGLVSGSWKVHITEELSAVSRNSPALGGAISPELGRPQAPKHQKEKVGLIQGHWKISEHLK